MSLQPMEIAPVPDETARVARAAFPKGNVWLSLRNELGTIYCDELFADLYPRRGQPAGAPWRVALVLVMEFADGPVGPRAPAQRQGGSARPMPKGSGWMDISCSTPFRPRTRSPDSPRSRRSRRCGGSKGSIEPTRAFTGAPRSRGCRRRCGWWGCPTTPRPATPRNATPPGSATRCLPCLSQIRRRRCRSGNGGLPPRKRSSAGSPVRPSARQQGCRP